MEKTYGFTYGCMPLELYTVLRWKGPVSELLHLPNHAADPPRFLVDILRGAGNLAKNVEGLYGRDESFNGWELQVVASHNLKYWFEDRGVELQVFTCRFDELTTFWLPSLGVGSQQQVFVLSDPIPQFRRIIPPIWNPIQLVRAHHTSRGWAWWPRHGLWSHTHGLGFGHPFWHTCQSQQRSAQEWRLVDRSELRFRARAASWMDLGWKSSWIMKAIHETI